MKFLWSQHWEGGGGTLRRSRLARGSMRLGVSFEALDPVLSHCFQDAKSAVMDCSSFGTLRKMSPFSPKLLFSL